MSSEILLEGKYRLDGELGCGGMGTVFRAVDESLDRVVAIKFLLPEHQEERDAVERFRREAKAMASVRHENVVQIHSFGCEGDVDFFVMELVDGQTLAEILMERRSRSNVTHIPLDTVVRYLDQACAGLSAIHDAGMVHRDIKPGNLMLEALTERLVIMDFGLGRTRKRPSDPRRLRIVSGTAGYLAPEIIDGRQLEDWEEVLGDIYALGVTAFELLTGRLPFDADCASVMLDRQCNEDPPPPSAYRSEIPEVLDELVVGCMSRDPAKRFQWCAELRGALQPLLSFSSPHSVVPTCPPPASPKPSTHQAIMSSVEPSVGPVVVVASNDAGLRNVVFHCSRTVLGDCSFKAARSALSALEMSRSEPPLIVVASLQDPKLNGLELAATMLGDSAFEDVSLILTTRCISTKDKRLLERMGVFRVLLEPVESEELEDVLRAAKEQHRRAPSRAEDDRCTEPVDH
jgi:serine/threonine-protein kinase